MGQGLSPFAPRLFGQQLVSDLIGARHEYAACLGLVPPSGTTWRGQRLGKVHANGFVKAGQLAQQRRIMFEEIADDMDTLFAVLPKAELFGVGQALVIAMGPRQKAA